MLTIDAVKALGSAKNRSEENLDYLIKLFVNDLDEHKIPVEVKREIVSSIGRSRACNETKVKAFLHDYALQTGKQIPMDVIYQMFRTALYMSVTDKEMDYFVHTMLTVYHNEVMDKMYLYHRRRWAWPKPPSVHEVSPITHPLLLSGNSQDTLQGLPSNSIQLIFTSPPYYNAREYTNYTNYTTYLDTMESVFKECNRVLEKGRFMVINVSPVITRRPGREFESIRYPIHYDLHSRLCNCGFQFIDEIYWIKPEPSVPNRIGGYLQTRKPLGYKPNCITESIMVYRKECNFLLDAIMAKYPNYDQYTEEEVDTSNCWYITPKSDKDHPAVFPEELCRRILKYYSYKGDVVLDPFAGSGTFGKVALKMDRIPVLCESNPEYIKVIKKKGGF